MEPDEHQHAHEHDHGHGLDECIEACTACYLTCMSAIHQSLKVGGEHAAPARIRLMMACAEMCRASAHIMMTGYRDHAAVRAACAELCEACADDCERVGDMEDCVIACRHCAHVCQTMA